MRRRWRKVNKRLMLSKLQNKMPKASKRSLRLQFTNIRNIATDTLTLDQQRNEFNEAEIHQSQLSSDED